MPVAVVETREMKVPKGALKVVNTDQCSYESCRKSGKHYVWFLDHQWDKFLVCTDHKDEFESTLKEILNG